MLGVVARPGFGGWLRIETRTGPVPGYWSVRLLGSGFGAWIGARKTRDMPSRAHVSIVRLGSCLGDRPTTRTTNRVQPSGPDIPSRLAIVFPPQFWLFSSTPSRNRIQRTASEYEYPRAWANRARCCGLQCNALATSFTFRRRPPSSRWGGVTGSPRRSSGAEKRPVLPLMHGTWSVTFGSGGQIPCTGWKATMRRPFIAKSGPGQARRKGWTASWNDRPGASDVRRLLIF